MPNPYFQFKQFTVYHDQCAMKVGTDGVLLGAWADASTAKTVLDIGTGTGLLALMLSQKNNKIRVDAIDIDARAIDQAMENVKNSPFTGQIQCYRLPLQEFVSKNRKYDLIVSNPPYFIGSLKSPDNNRTLARHTDSLYADDLIRISSDMLNERGKIAVIYPHDYKEKLILLAKENNLFVSRLTNIFPKPGSLPKRILIELSKEQTVSNSKESDLIIEKERHVYTDEFIRLVKDFYLKL